MILHIANDFSGSKVYKELISALDHLNIPQLVYNPIRDPGRIGKNKVQFQMAESELIYSLVLNNTTDRLLYKRKINKIVKDLESKIDFSKIKLIHAHTWYSDGGVAYLLHKKYNIPYIIAVRNTDINVHYKFLLHERSFGEKILQYASRIILIGEYQKAFFNEQTKVEPAIKDKLMVVPNGVDPFWLAHSRTKTIIDKASCFKILYVGTLIKRKNVVALAQAILSLKQQYPNICLRIVGGTGKDQPTIETLASEYPDTIIYNGPVRSRHELQKIYSTHHIFAMPSKHETFGLVYAEALLQGLPILYTANEGIDGFYPDTIGEKVVNGDIEEIAEKLKTMIINYNTYTIPIDQLRENHDWSKIALHYKKIYCEVI